MKTSNNWWDDSRGVQRHLGDAFAEEDIPVVLKALQDRTCVSTGRSQGTEKTKGEEFLDKLRSMGIIPYYRYNTMIRCAGSGEFIYWTTDAKGVVTVSWTASGEPRGNELQKLVTEWLEPIPTAVKVPPVYGFSFEHGQYMVREIGHLKDTFCEGNYTPEVVKKYGRVVEELNKPEPAGRLTLVEGEPGTGKTRMIRALIGALMESSKCIVVPRPSWIVSRVPSSPCASSTSGRPISPSP